LCGVRRVAIWLAAVAVISSTSTAWSACGATIGASAIPLTTAEATFSAGLDGSVRSAATPAARITPGQIDASGRYTVLWKQGRKSPLVQVGTAKDVTLAQHVGSPPVWAPTGDVLAFGQMVSGVNRLRVADFGPRVRIRQLGVPVCTLGGPAWSPDGRYLALVSPNDQRHCERGSQLVVVDASSGAVTGRAPVTDPVPTTPVWSGDGRFAAESGVLGAAGVAITARTARVGVSHGVTGCANAVWAPRGATLAAVCGTALALVDGRSGARTDLSVADVSPGPGPVWSGDGSRVAVATRRGIALTTTDGRTRAVVPLGGCWAGGVVGFAKVGRALIQASIAPPPD
jgi:hypothetical protein